MRRLPPHGKEKCGSPRVTLRLHHLKEKKEKGKVTPAEHDAYDSSNMEGGKPGGEDVAVKEAGEEPEVAEGKENLGETGGNPEAPEVEGAAVKRTHSTEEEEETKKKRRKDDNSSRGKSGSNSGGSPKSAVGGESENEDNKSVESPGPKVPPLKIVIPGASLEEQGTRNGKNGNARHHQALPYVVSSTEGEGSPPPSTSAPAPAPTQSSEPEPAPSTAPVTSDDQRTHQRVLRSHRSGNSSSGASGNPSPVGGAEAVSPRQVSPTPGADAPAAADIPSEDKPSEEAQTHATTVATPNELHPRKRKLKPKEQPPAPETHPEPTASQSADQQITNCYQLFLNIRKQIDRRRKGLFPVQPKPPQGFKDYLMNRCTYVLAGNSNNRVPPPHASPPPSLNTGMRDLFVVQEKERYRLRMQHVIEKEKLVLSVEQEILRVHGRAARALANQALPFSACTILRDEEVYSPFTPEQEEKDRNARSRYNGRLFLSWLQDVDDKWEKIKEAMLLRHHNEAESLHAVQRMDWEWKMKELGICESKAKPVIEDSHVPMVHVSDDFDLLPA